ncbi:acyl-CoA thioesterase [Acuticoccus mangrovi]|uniref:Acyl-CoA thioesterase n=1 Tax=Acuticoccus mangrovi TaxID=2796142 RepID=A0A934INU0_9HYPH|nr:hotdog domain-containing protein [Acuticoccus mangrovi]MBJ3775612.1 acyl-CoA thioesterase [Acuticoccus mangrovi]
MTASAGGEARATSLLDVVFPGETNHHGTLFGGAALAKMDKVAFITATRHAPATFVTASCERIDFLEPARLGDIVELVGRVVRAGRRSLGVKVTLTAEAPVSGERRRVAVGIFNMVAVDAAAAMPEPPAAAPPATGGRVTMADFVMPGETSHYGSLYGGRALAAMGKAAFITASRACRRPVVLASTKRLDFTDQIGVGELIEIDAAVVATGRTSLTVAVTLTAETPANGERRPCGHGTFVMVATAAAGAAPAGGAAAA